MNPEEFTVPTFALAFEHPPIPMHEELARELFTAHVNADRVVMVALDKVTYGSRVVEAYRCLGVDRIVVERDNRYEE